MTKTNGNPNESESQPPPWLAAFMDILSHCIEMHSPMGPLGWRYLEEEAYTELEVYPTPVEIVGGQWDGQLLVPGFSLDVGELLSAFAKVEAVRWSSQGMADDEGAHLSIEGIYEGNDLWVRILAEPPEDEPPGMQLDVPDS